MKKIRLVSFLLVAVLSTVACGSSDREPFTPGQPETPEQPGGDDNGEPDTPALGGNGRYLVLYASRTNNTGRVAQLIQTTLGCDLLEVEPETPYDNIWMLSRKSWIAPIPGTTNPGHLDDFLGAGNIRLTSREMEEFDREYAKIDLMGHRADPFTESQIDK